MRLRLPALSTALFVLSVSVSASDTPQPTAPDLALSGTISARSIREDELLQFSLNIRNKGDSKTGTAAERITLGKIPDSYSLAPNKPICLVLPAEVPVCLPAEKFAQGDLLASTLAPGQGLTVQGYLKPSLTHNTSLLTAVVQWEYVDPANSKITRSSAQTVSLGENQVLSDKWYHWGGFDAFLKVLAIPAMLGLFTAVTSFILNWLNQQHEARIALRERAREQIQQQAETAREERQRQHEQEQTFRSETWKQMLPVSHTCAAKYYLPLSLAADRQASHLRALSTPEARPRVAFFYTLLCGREMIRTRRATGGFYFKDLRGETLAADCWRRQREALMGTDEEAPINLALRVAADRIMHIESYAEFKKKFPEVTETSAIAYVDADVQAAWSLFDIWRMAQKSVDDVAKYLEALSAVLDCESNRPYAYWYDTPLRLLASTQTENTLREVLKENKYRQEEIDDYLRAVVRP